MRPAALLAAALVAGCVSNVAPDLGAPAAGEATTIPWLLTTCRYVVGWSEADAAAIERNLPDGFRVATGTPFGLPLPVAQAIIGTEAFECESGSGLNGTLEPMLYASIWIPVVPPPDLAVEGIDEVYYKFDVLVPDAPRREAMAARGLPVGDGTVEWTRPTAPNGVAARSRIEGAGAFAFEMATTRTLDPGEPREFMEITPAGEKGAGGFAVWRAKFAWEGSTFSQGRGFLDWPEGHWVTDAIGRARAPATFHAGTWSFAGTLTLPLE